MSLHHIAKHLQEQGRGPDDMLVHMTSGELGALQHLAKAHGGSLTVNPQTGLPEAGFLSSILPMAAGALAVALAPETGGMSLEAYSALAAGGIGLADYAITGSLQQGLMAGLGAWGGAGLTSGIAGLGSAAADAANPEIIAQQLGVSGAATGPGSQAAMLAEQNAGLGADALNATKEAAAGAIPAGAQTAAQAAAAGAPAGTAIQQAPIQNQFLSGLQSGNVMNYMGNHLGQVASAALPAVLSSGNLFGKQNTVPGLPQQKNPFGMKEIPKDANGNPIFNASLPAPPNPAYKPTYPNYVANPYVPVGSADGGLMQDKLDYASGGMFPGSQIDKTQYAESPQMPASMQQTMAGYDPMTNPLTGEEVQHMADGGLPYIQQSQNQPATANGYTPAGSGSTYGQGQFSPQTNAMPPTGLAMMNQMNPQGMPPQGTPGIPQMGIAPQTNFAMGGVAGYAGTDYGSLVSGMKDVEEGIDLATKPKKAQRLEHNQGLREALANEVSIAPDESSIANLDSYNRTLALHKNNLTASHVKPTKGLPQGAVLGSIDLTPAAQAAAEAQAKQSIAGDQGSQEAKEGGLMAMAVGGTPLPGSGAGGDFKPTGGMISNALVGMGAAGPSHVYQPSYANYAQTPYSPQVSQGIPMPTRGSGIPAQGYAMDPLKMQGSPAYNANQAAQQAQLQQIMAAAGGMASGGLSGYANGGMSNLGGYSDGGHLLKGPGDGVSDSIPATIGGKQPARLAEGEFVIPARIVSELGNGSTDAGAKRLYAMMDRIKAKRAKTKNIAADTKAYKYLPA
jgi:hypothetical protein